MCICMRMCVYTCIYVKACIHTRSYWHGRRNRQKYEYVYTSSLSQHARVYVYMQIRRSNPWTGVTILLDFGWICFPVGSAALRRSPFATDSDHIALRTDPQIDVN